jgi:hypothetical protein
MIGLTVDAGDHFKKRAAIPLAPCTWSYLGNFSTIAKNEILDLLSTEGWNGRKRMKSS